MEQATVTLVVGALGICGTLGGIVGGHFLSRSWQREQWIRDRRNEDFRDLIDALGKSFRLECSLRRGEVLTIEHKIEFREDHARTIHIIGTRLFIADFVNKYDVELIWVEAVNAHWKTMDTKALTAVYTELYKLIVREAARGISAWSLYASEEV